MFECRNTTWMFGMWQTKGWILNAIAIYCLYHACLVHLKLLLCLIWGRCLGIDSKLYSFFIWPPDLWIKLQVVFSSLTSVLRSWPMSWILRILCIHMLSRLVRDLALQGCGLDHKNFGRKCYAKLTWGWMFCYWFSFSGYCLKNSKESNAKFTQVRHQDPVRGSSINEGARKSSPISLFLNKR